MKVWHAALVLAAIYLLIPTKRWRLASVSGLIFVIFFIVPGD